MLPRRFATATLHGGQKVLGVPLSLTGAFMDLARISRDGCITPGNPVVRWPQGAHGLQRDPFTIDQGSHRLISLKGAPAVDWVLFGALNSSKEISLLQQASYVYQEISLRRLHIVGKISIGHRGPIVLEKPFVGLKGPLIGSRGPLSNSEIFR